MLFTSVWFDANEQSSFHVACECKPSPASSETINQIRAICNVEGSLVYCLMIFLLPCLITAENVIFNSLCGTSLFRVFEANCEYLSCSTVQIRCSPVYRVLEFNPLIIYYMV